MSKKKGFFITFEGIEGSGKTYQSKKLFKKLKKMKLSVIHTREPGGTVGAEIIRDIILTGKKNKFTKTTDTLLYLAARNEHIEKVLSPTILKGKNIICDRYMDSTMAYQVYGKNVDKKLVNSVHQSIVKNITPEISFILKLNIKNALKRVKKRKKINRYDKFSLSYYQKVQNAFIDIAKKNKKRCIIVNTSENTKDAENIIFERFLRFYKNEKRHYKK